MNEETVNTASRGKRLAGLIIDGIITLVTLVPALIATGLFSLLYSSEEISATQQINLFFIGYAVFFIFMNYG